MASSRFPIQSRTRRAAALWAALALCACGTYASIEPSRMDPAPLMTCELDLPSDLHERFSGYRVAPKRSSTQVASRSFSTGSPKDRTRWNGSATVWRYAAPDAAVEAFRARCKMYAVGFPAAEVKTLESADRRSCLTPVGQERNDPEGARLPTNQYLSAVVVQRESMVFDLFETRTGPATGSEPANEVILDVSRRLCRHAGLDREPQD